MMIKVKRVYVDTSVVGGKFDPVFAELSAPFWDAVMNGEIIIIVSKLLEDELKHAPQIVRDFFQSIPEFNIERVELTEEADDLAEQYLAERVVGKSSRSDCQHIAIASICRADVLISWNFKHIVNINRIRGYNSVNLKLGYPMIDIRNPSEVINYEKDIS